LWYLEERTDVAHWFGARGWTVNATPAADLMARYHRQPPADMRDPTPRTVFVDATLG
jgi:O-methyltransferase involved in polyketide biosynthesis